jgi:hypothetical protein
MVLANGNYRHDSSAVHARLALHFSCGPLRRQDHALYEQILAIESAAFRYRETAGTRL